MIAAREWLGEIDECRRWLFAGVVTIEGLSRGGCTGEMDSDASHSLMFKD